MSNDSASADEADAGEDAQREPHDIELNKRGGRLSGGGDEEVGLNHRKRGGKTDEHGGTHACGLAATVAVESDDEAGYGGEGQT